MKIRIGILGIAVYEIRRRGDDLFIGWESFRSLYIFFHPLYIDSNFRTHQSVVKATLISCLPNGGLFAKRDFFFFLDSTTKSKPPPPSSRANAPPKCTHEAHIYNLLP